MWFILGFDTETDLEESYISSSSKVIAGVIFDSSLRNGIQDTEPINYIVSYTLFLFFIKIIFILLPKPDVSWILILK